MTEKRVAIVTGASRGIGESIARRLAADGLHVVLVARSADRLASVVNSIATAGGSAEAIMCDVASSADVQKMVEDVGEKHGRIDVLVNNAGINRDTLLLRMDDQQFDEVINTNLKSVFVATRSAARYLMRAKQGRIINIGSVSGVIGNKGQANYAASKAALSGFTKTVARELAGKAVTANVVAPGFVTTDMTGALPEKVHEEVRKLIPLGRFGEPQEIAALVAFLAGESSGYLTGQVICVDGGMAM